VKSQTNNIGLRRQWLEVWQPSEDGREAAFIFEDDMEVSFLPLPCTQRTFRQMPFTEPYISFVPIPGFAVLLSVGHERGGEILRQGCEPAPPASTAATRGTNGRHGRYRHPGGLSDHATAAVRRACRGKASAVRCVVSLWMDFCVIV
jgi:hypothetical protein